jgi:hypothetical protein
MVERSPAHRRALIHIPISYTDPDTVERIHEQVPDAPV